MYYIKGLTRNEHLTTKQEGGKKMKVERLGVLKILVNWLGLKKISTGKAIVLTSKAAKKPLAALISIADFHLLNDLLNLVNVLGLIRRVRYNKSSNQALLDIGDHASETYSFEDAGNVKQLLDFVSNAFGVNFGIEWENDEELCLRRLTEQAYDFAPIQDLLHQNQEEK